MSARTLNTDELRNWLIQVKFQTPELAALLRISQRQLQRRIRDSFGKTPTALVRQHRCELGLEYLKKGFSTKATAEKLGYASATDFCHDFKKHYGQSPQQMLRSILGISSVLGPSNKLAEVL